jgi:hypothetical protein
MGRHATGSALALVCGLVRAMLHSPRFTHPSNLPRAFVMTPFARLTSCRLTWLLASVLLSPAAFAASAGAPSLVGAWQLESGEQVLPDGTVTRYDRDAMKALKVISAGHFSFTSHKGGKFYAAAGGSYSAQDGKYTERPDYASYAPMVGQSYRFSYELDGDQWRLSRWENGVRVEYEVWRRLD